MRKMTPEEVKQTEFDILCSFDDICKEHGLAYCLAYGTCLGAIRHEGFIPWDDDIDVYMPRDDYEALYRLYTDDAINWKYSIVSSRDGSSYHPTYKVTDPNTICHESFIDKRYSIGLWIDVFPLDAVDLSSDESKRTLKKIVSTNTKLRRKLSFAGVDPSEGSTPAARLIKRIATPFSRNLDPIIIGKEIEKNSRSLPYLLSSDNKQKLSLVDISESVGNTVYSFPYSMIFPAAFATFEGRVFPVPGKTEDYLTRCYDNWQALPPEDERHFHFAEAYTL